jgi:O-antigen/teichoic acid export membrane protein
LPVAYAAMAFRQPLILLIVGHKYMDAEAAVPGLMLAVAIIFPASLITYMLVVTHLQRWNLPLAILACGINIGLNLWLIPRAGYVAAAWTTAATEAFVLIYNLTVLGVATRIRPAIRPIGKVLLAALPFGVALIPGVPTYAAAGVAIIVYGVLLIVLGVVRPSQLRVLMADKTDAATAKSTL